MSEIINIDCFKISKKLNLSLVATYFNIQMNRSKSDFIRLNDYSISAIIKVRSASKSLFIYEYGCVVFINFTSDEEYLAVKYLKNIIGSIDYNLIARFRENLKLAISSGQIISINDRPCNNKFNDDILSIACRLISKSTALSSLEEEVIGVLDKAENIVNRLQQAKLRTNTRKFFSSISHIAHFQHSAIKTLELFDVTFSYKNSADSKNFYNMLQQYYEIKDRTNVLEDKIEEVSGLISSYTTLSYNRQEMRLLIFECILLAMFLLPHLINVKALFTRNY